jgi:hypothetical protein
MPNIKGISTDSQGNVSITQSDNSKYDLVRDDLAKSVEDTTGTSLKDKPDFDVYTHCYEDLTKINTKRTAVMVVQKGIKPQDNWWVVEDMKGVIK